MKFGAINGNVTTEGYKDWIELQSFQWAVNRHMTSGGRGDMRESSAPSVSEIVVTKYNDISSTALLNETFGSRSDAKVTIKLSTTSKNKTETYLTYELAECAISSISQSAQGGEHHDAPLESLSLNFVKIAIIPTPLDKSGQIKKGMVVEYNLLKMATS